MQGLPDKMRLLAWLSSLLVAGFLAVSIASYQVSKDTVREGIVSHELPLTGDNIYSEIQKDLLRPIFISSVMAQDTFLRDWVIAGEQDATAVTRYLKEIKDRYQTVTSFFVSDNTRTYYHSQGILKTVREDEPRDVWYFRVRAMSDPFEINVDPDLANRDAMTIFINYRVFDYEGRFIGVTGVGLTVDTVRHLIESYQKRFQRRVYFVDKEGRVVLRGRGSGQEGVSLQEIPGFGGLVERVLKTGTEGATFEYMAGDSTVLLNTRFIPELGWHLLVEQNIDESFRLLRAALFGNLTISFIVTLVVLLVAGYTVNRYQTRLEEMATTDKLSGLMNRQALDLVFRQAVRDLQRREAPLSAILLDVDHFKEVNDRLGHLAGDRVIAALAERLRESVRESDVIGRWGGEEFLVLLKNCDLAQAMTVAEKIRTAMASRDFVTEGVTWPVTVSLGVAQFRPGESEDSLVGRADAALYRAKSEGRNRLVAAEK